MPTWLQVALCVLGWLACAVGAYLLLWRDWRRVGYGLYAPVDRWFTLVFALVLAPYALLLGVAYEVAAWRDDRLGAGKE